MAESRLPKSIRKYLRHEKARIRQQAVDKDEAGRRISTLVAEIRARFTTSLS
jgi:hypothetical protein